MMSEERLWRISKWVMKIVRHLDLKDREIDGTVHWKSMGPKLRYAFEKEGGYNFSDSQWIDYIWNGSKLRHTFQTEGGYTFSDSQWLHSIWKGSNKTRIQYCKNYNDVLWLFAPFKGERKEGHQNSILHILDPSVDEALEEESTTIYRGREKCTTRVNGSVIRTPSAGSTWPGHKKRDCSFGRQGLTPLL